MKQPNQERTRRAPTVARVLSLAALACIALLVLGCTPKTKSWTSYRDEGFDPTTVIRESCAVGGVVLRDGVVLDRFAGVDYASDEFTHEVQANLWSPLLDDAFRTVLKREPEAGWFTYRSLVPEATRDQVLAAQARMGLVSPVVLEECRASLPGIRFLLLARIEETILDASFVGDYGGDKASGRLVQMTMDIYDLEIARSVWTRTNGAFDGGPGNPSDDEISAMRRVQLPDSTGAPMTIAGQVLKAPPLDNVMASCLRKLLGDLSGVYGGRTQIDGGS